MTISMTTAQAAAMRNAALLPNTVGSGNTFLSDKQVAIRYSVTRQTVWRWARERADFPKAVTLSQGCTRWRKADLEAWEATR